MPSTPRSVTELTYEQARDELVTVVARLEAGGETLEASLTLWERGEALAARCLEWLDGARARLEATDPSAATTRPDGGRAPGSEGVGDSRSGGNGPGGNAPGSNGSGGNGSNDSGPDDSGPDGSEDDPDLDDDSGTPDDDSSEDEA